MDITGKQELPIGHVGIHQDVIRPIFIMIGQPPQEICGQPHICVKDDHDLAAGLPDAPIPGLAAAAAPRVNEAHPLPGVTPDDLRGAVAGIIHHDDLPVGIIESQEGLQGGGDIRFLIVGRDDDAEPQLDSSPERGIRGRSPGGKIFRNTRRNRPGLFRIASRR